VEEWRLVGGEWCGVVVFRRAEKKDRLRTNKRATDLAGDRTMKRWIFRDLEGLEQVSDGDLRNLENKTVDLNLE
jgi:hypothetical protein